MRPSNSCPCIQGIFFPFVAGSRVLVEDSRSRVSSKPTSILQAEKLDFGGLLKRVRVYIYIYMIIYHIHIVIHIYIYACLRVPPVLLTPCRGDHNKSGYIYIYIYVFIVLLIQRSYRGSCSGSSEAFPQRWRALRQAVEARALRWRLLRPDPRSRGSGLCVFF